MFSEFLEPDKLFRDLPGGTGHLGREGGVPHPLRRSFEHGVRSDSACARVASDVLGACPCLAVVGVAELEWFAVLKLCAASAAGEGVDASLDDPLAFLLMCCVVSALIAGAALLLVSSRVFWASLLGTEFRAAMLSADSHAGHGHLTASGYDEAPNHWCDSGLSLEPVRPFNQ